MMTPGEDGTGRTMWVHVSVSRDDYKRANNYVDFEGFASGNAVMQYVRDHWPKNEDGTYDLLDTPAYHLYVHSVYEYFDQVGAPEKYADEEMKQWIASRGPPIDWPDGPDDEAMWALIVLFPTWNAIDYMEAPPIDATFEPGEA